MNRSSFSRFAFLLVAAILLTVSVASAAGPFQFYSVTPCRLADTRDQPNGLTTGPALSHGFVRSFPIFGAAARPCGIPTDAKAAALNVTVVAPQSYGHLTIYPYNSSIPLVSTLNYATGEGAIANGAIVPLSSDATFQVSVLPVLGYGPGYTTHVILDITGYFK